jgi:7,8-dihydro-6-hydroxymethylpterin-pyrophosphokinase
MEKAMLITKTSILTGQTRTLDLDVTQEGLNRWKNGEHIQNVFPHLTVNEREFVMTGIFEDEWEAHFNDDD